MSIVGGNLPQELYLEIIAALDPMDSIDARHALVSLALASTRFLQGARRALFRSNGSIERHAQDARDTVHRHHQFVQTIFDNPRRFAGLVRVFTQGGLDPAQAARRIGYFQSEKRMRERLWELTIKTLPFMTNLRVLVLLGKPPGQYDNLLDFVLPMLRHLAIDTTREMAHEWISEPSGTLALTSVECDMQTFGRLARVPGRNIIAFAVTESGYHCNPGDITHCREALRQLRYYRIEGNTRRRLLEFRRLIAGYSLAIEILELDGYLVGPLNNPGLGDFPELRLLSMRLHKALWPTRNFRIITVLATFQQFEKLQKVIYSDEDHQIRWVYSRPVDLAVTGNAISWLSRAGAFNGPDNAEGLEIPGRRDYLEWEKALSLDRAAGEVWWETLEDLLQ